MLVLTGVAGIIYPINYLYEKLKSSNHLMVNDAIQALAGMPYQDSKIRDEVLNSISSLCDRKKLTKQYSSATGSSTAGANHTLHEAIKAFEHLEAYKELNELAQQYFLPSIWYSSEKEEKESIQYTKRTIIEIYKNMYSNMKFPNGVFSDKFELLDKILGYINDSSGIVKGTAKNSLKELASEESIRHLLNKSLSIPLMEFLGDLFKAPENGMRDYSKEFSLLRIDAELLLKKWAFFGNAGRELKKTIARNMFKMNVELAAADIQTLKQNEGGYWYLYAESTNTLEQLVEEDKYSNLKFHAETQLILRGERQWVTEEFIKNLSNPPGGDDIKLLLIPKLCEIMHESATKALAYLLRGKSKKVAVAIRNTLNKGEGNIYHCFELADKFNEDFMVDIYHKDQERASYNYINLLHAADQFINVHQRNLLDTLVEKQKEKQMQMTQESIISIKNKQLFDEIIKTYRQEEAKIIIVQNSSEIYLEGEFPFPDSNVLALSLSGEKTDLAVLLSRNSDDPNVLNFLDKCLSDSEISERMKVAINNENCDKSEILLMGRIIDKTAEYFIADIGSKQLKAHIPYNEMDIVQNEEIKVEDYIGNIICAKAMNVEQLRKQPDIDFIELSRKEYLKSRVLYNLENNTEINVKIIGISPDNKTLVVEYRECELEINRDEITYSSSRMWYESLAIGTTVKATIQKSGNSAPIASLCKNRPIYDVPNLIAKYGSQEFRVAYVDETKFELLDELPGVYCIISPGFVFHKKEDEKDLDFLFPTQRISQGDILTVRFEIQNVSGAETSANSTDNQTDGEDEEDNITLGSKEVILAVVDIDRCEPDLEYGQSVRAIVEEKSENGDSVILNLILEDTLIKGQLELPRSLAETYEKDDKIIVKYDGYDKEHKIARLKLMPLLQVGGIYYCHVSENSVGTIALNVRSGPLKGQIPISNISYSLEKEIVIDNFRQMLRNNRYYIAATLDKYTTRSDIISRKNDVERLFGEEFIGDIIDIKNSGDCVALTQNGGKLNFNFTIFNTSLEPPKIGERIEIRINSDGKYFLKIHTAESFTLRKNISVYEDCLKFLESQPEHTVTYAGLKDGFHRFEIEPGNIFRVARNQVESVNISLDISELEIGDKVLIKKIRKGIQIVKIESNILKRLTHDRSSIECFVTSILPSNEGVELEICDNRYPIRPYISGSYRLFEMSNTDKVKFENKKLIDNEISVRIDSFAYNISEEKLNIEFSSTQIQDLDIISLLKRKKNEHPLFLDAQIVKIDTENRGGRQYWNVIMRLTEYPKVLGVVLQYDISYNLSLRRVIDKVTQMQQRGTKVSVLVDDVDVSNNTARLSLIDSKVIDFEQFLLINENHRGKIQLTFIKINDQKELVFEFLPGIHFSIQKSLVRVQGSHFNIEYISHDVVEATVSTFQEDSRKITGLNILNLYSPPTNEFKDKGFAFQGKYIGKHSGQDGDEWEIELFVKDRSMICYMKLQREELEPQIGKMEFFTYNYTDNYTESYDKVYVRLVADGGFLVWVTIDSIGQKGIIVKWNENDRVFIHEDELSWGRKPLSYYDGFFKVGFKILSTRICDKKGNIHWSIKQNRQTYVHYFEQHGSEFLFKRNILTYYYYDKERKSLKFEYKPGVNITIPLSQFSYNSRLRSLKQGDMLDVYIGRDQSETQTLYLDINSIIHSQAHYVERGMLVEQVFRGQDRGRIHFKDYDYLFGEYVGGRGPINPKYLEILETESNQSWNKDDRCLIVGLHSRNSFMRFVDLLRIEFEENRIVATTGGANIIEWYINNQEITYRIDSKDEIMQRISDVKKNGQFLCIVLDEDKRILSLRRNLPFSFTWLENLGINHPFELVFVGEELYDVIFEYSYGRIVAVPKVLIERKNGKYIDSVRWKRYKPGDIFLVDIVDLNRGEIKFKGLKINRITQSPLHKLNTDQQYRQFIRASIKYVYQNRIVVDFEGMEISLEKSGILEEYRANFINIFEDKKSRNEPICIEVTSVNEYGDVYIKQQETDISKILKCGDIFDGKIISRSGDVYYIEIPGCQQCSAVLPMTEINGQYQTLYGDSKEGEINEQPYCQFMDIGKMIRVQVIKRTEDAIYVSRANLVDSFLMKYDYPQITNVKTSEPKGSILDGCIKQKSGEYILVEAYGTEFLVEANETVWGANDAPLEPGNSIEMKIIYFDKQKKRLSLSIKEANIAWTEDFDQLDNTIIHSICNNGLIVEYRGSLGFIAKDELAWCPEYQIMSISDIFHESEQVQVFKKGRDNDIELSLKSGQMQLSMLDEGTYVKAIIKRKADYGIYVSVKGLISFVPKEIIASELYQSLQEQQEVELELTKIDNHFQVAQFRLAQKMDESLPESGIQILPYNFDRYYDFRLRNIIKELSRKDRSEESIDIFKLVFEEIISSDIRHTHTNIKLFLNELHRLNMLDVFIDFANSNQQYEPNDLLKCLLTGTKIYASELTNKEINTNCADDFFVAGYINILKDQISDGLIYLSNAYKCNNKSLDINLTLADVFFKNGQYKQHEALIENYVHMVKLENLLRLPDVYVPPSGLGKERADFEYAEEQFGLGNMTESILRFKGVTNRKVEPVVCQIARLNVAICHIVLGQYYDANNMIEEIRASKNKEIMSMDEYYKVSLLTDLYLGNLAQFKENLRDYINQYDKSSDAAVLLAYILAFEGFYNAANNIIDKIQSKSPEIVALRQFLAYKLKKQITPDWQSLSASRSYLNDETRLIYRLPKFNSTRPEQFFQTCLEHGTLEAIEPMLQKNLPLNFKLKAEYIKLLAIARKLTGNVDKYNNDQKRFPSEVNGFNLPEIDKSKLLESFPIESSEVISNQIRDYWNSLMKIPNGIHKIVRYAQNLQSQDINREILSSGEAQQLSELLSKVNDNISELISKV